MDAGPVIAKSLARIHETNLKKQGVLALTFAKLSDYDLILEDDRISLLELGKMAPGRQVQCVVSHMAGSQDVIMLNHSYNEMQLEWFRAGSALNVLKGSA